MVEGRGSSSRKIKDFCGKAVLADTRRESCLEALVRSFLCFVQQPVGTRTRTIKATAYVKKCISCTKLSSCNSNKKEKKPAKQL